MLVSQRLAIRAAKCVRKQFRHIVMVLKLLSLVFLLRHAVLAGHLLQIPCDLGRDAGNPGLVAAGKFINEVAQQALFRLATLRVLLRARLSREDIQPVPDQMVVRLLGVFPFQRSALHVIGLFQATAGFQRMNRFVFVEYLLNCPL